MRLIPRLNPTRSNMSMLSEEGLNGNLTGNKVFMNTKPGKNRIDGKKDEKGAPSLYVYSTCTNFIREMETYRWHEKSVSKAQDLNEPDVPEKANDHICDALRYFAVSYSPISKTDQQRYGKDYEFINVDEKKDIWRIGK